MEINLEELAEFLVKAKKATYAGNGKEVTPERPGFKELGYSEGLWNYRDSYIGYYSGHGDEVVRLSGLPIWHMSYNWHLPTYSSDRSEEIFGFLKDALSNVEESMPFRGPRSFHDERYKYSLCGPVQPDDSIYSSIDRIIKSFSGKEKIRTKGRESKQVYFGIFSGGLIIPK